MKWAVPAFFAMPLLWPPTALAGQATHVFISASGSGPYGDYAPSAETEEPGNLIQDVLSCGFEHIEVISQPRVTDGGMFAVRVRKDRWLNAAMPCLKKTLPEGFEIVDDQTVED